LPNINLWKDKMSKNIKETLEKYEKRLMNHQVNIELTEEEFVMEKLSTQKKIKHRVDLKLRANIKKTNEAFVFQETLYISPVWLN
jgi:hypothetical protein